MTDRRRYAIAAGEAIICTTLAMVVFYGLKLEKSLYILYVPVEIITNFLRQISLTSALGNIVACIFYSLISIIPLIMILYIRKRRPLSPVDLFLPIISILTFYMLYKFINPTLLMNLAPDGLRIDDTVPFLKMIN